MNQIEFTSYVSLSGSLDGFTLNFKSGVNIESKNGCFIKFTFPISFDFTGKSFESVTISGMLVDSDGNEQNLTQDKVYSNLWNSSRTSTWFAIEGC